MSSLRARNYAILSIGAALLTIALKFGAYFLTGSVGLFSDAAESCVNLIAAVVALWALTFAALPPDAEHAFGHSKAEYFSSGVEGTLILVAAGTIAIAAIDSEALPPRADRLAHPQPLEQLGLALGLSLLATAVNGGVALILLRAGRRLRSIALQRKHGSLKAPAAFAAYPGDERRHGKLRSVFTVKLSPKIDKNVRSILLL